MTFEKKRIKKSITPEKALLRLADLCSRSEQCEYDIRKKLRDWGLYSDADKIIAELYDQHFLDEGRFASAFCRDKVRFAGWGRYKIRMALRFKQISSGVIASALEAIDEEEYIKSIDRFIRSKINQYDTDSYIERQKLLKSAVQRGYEPAIVVERIKVLPREDI